jgi:hypothetical protein
MELCGLLLRSAQSLLFISINQLRDARILSQQRGFYTLSEIHSTDGTVNIPYAETPGGLGAFCLQNYYIKRNIRQRRKLVLQVPVLLAKIANTVRTVQVHVL